MSYHLEALNIRRNLASKDNLAKSLTKMGDTYVKLGEIDLAKKYLFESLKIAKEVQISTLLRGNYKALMELNEISKDYKNAFEYQKLFIAIKDSIFNKEKNKQLVELKPNTKRLKRTKK